MLIRLDPEQGRDRGHVDPARPARSTIPGHGVDKINAAYAIGGAELDASRRSAACCDIPINHVVNVNFGGFRARSTASAASTSTSTAATSTTTTRRGGGGELRDDRHQAGLPAAVRPGRARLRPLPPPRHRLRARRAPAGLPRARRRTQVGVGRLFCDRKELLRIFGRYTQTDIDSERRDPAAAAAGLRGREAPDPRGPLPGRDRERRRRLVRDDHRRQPAQDRPASSSNCAGIRRRRARADDDDHEDVRRAVKRQEDEDVERVGRARARARRGQDQGEDYVATMSTKAAASRLLPAARADRRGGYADQACNPRSTHQRPRRPPYRRYRIVVYAGDIGQYYGVQGTTWRSPPILDNPTRDAHASTAASTSCSTTAAGCGSSPGGRRGPSTGSRTRCSQTLDEPADARHRASLDLASVT